MTSTATHPVVWTPACVRPTGLIRAVRVDPAGRTGPTRGQARSASWERVAPGLHVPSTRPDLVEQRILEQACRLDDGAVTAWAALRWRGARYFDGLGPDGLERLPVDLAPAGNLRPASGSRVHRTWLGPSEREVVDGLTLATVQRALFDEIRRRGELVSAVQAIDMTAAAGLISVWHFAAYVGVCNSRTAAPLARHAVSLAVDESLSPQETRMRMIWRLDVGLPEPAVNRPVYDLAGRLIGVPDLLDPATGLVAEYDGEHHRSAGQHRVDVEREERFRDHGLEPVAVVRGMSRRQVAARLRRGHARAVARPEAERRWTLEPPVAAPVPENQTDRIERLGLAWTLTHR